MTPQQIEKLEIDALALRKIADSFLQQLEAVKKKTASAQGRKRKAVKVDRMAAIKARVLSGRRKPENIQKNQIKKPGGGTPD